MAAENVLQTTEVFNFGEGVWDKKTKQKFCRLKFQCWDLLCVSDRCVFLVDTSNVDSAVKCDLPLQGSPLSVSASVPEDGDLFLCVAVEGGTLHCFALCGGGGRGLLEVRTATTSPGPEGVAGVAVHPERRGVVCVWSRSRVLLYRQQQQQQEGAGQGAGPGAGPLEAWTLPLDGLQGRVVQVDWSRRRACGAGGGCPSAGNGTADKINPGPSISDLAADHSGTECQSSVSGPSSRVKPQDSGAGTVPTSLRSEESQREDADCDLSLLVLCSSGRLVVACLKGDYPSTAIVSTGQCDLSSEPIAMAMCGGTALVCCAAPLLKGVLASRTDHLLASQSTNTRVGAQLCVVDLSTPPRPALRSSLDLPGLVQPDILCTLGASRGSVLVGSSSSPLLLLLCLDQPQPAPVKTGVLGGGVQGVLGLYPDAEERSGTKCYAIVATRQAPADPYRHAFLSARPRAQDCGRLVRIDTDQLVRIDTDQLAGGAAQLEGQSGASSDKINSSQDHVLLGAVGKNSRTVGKDSGIVGKDSGGTGGGVLNRSAIPEPTPPHVTLDTLPSLDTPPFNHLVLPSSRTKWNPVQDLLSGETPVNSLVQECSVGEASKNPEALSRKSLLLESWKQSCLKPEWQQGLTLGGLATGLLSRQADCTAGAGTSRQTDSTTGVGTSRLTDSTAGTQSSVQQVGVSASSCPSGPALLPAVPGSDGYPTLKDAGSFVVDAQLETSSSVEVDRQSFLLLRGLLHLATVKRAFQLSSTASLGLRIGNRVVHVAADRDGYLPLDLRGHSQPLLFTVFDRHTS